MRTHDWDRERFRAILEEMCNLAHLTQADLAVLAGRSRSQINRWSRAENQPTFAAVQRLASAVATKHPEIAELTSELMEVAGYKERTAERERTHTAVAKAAPPEPPSPETSISSAEQAGFDSIDLIREAIRVEVMESERRQREERERELDGLRDELRQEIRKLQQAQVSPGEREHQEDH